MTLRHSCAIATGFVKIGRSSEEGKAENEWAIEEAVGRAYRGGGDIDFNTDDVDLGRDLRSDPADEGEVENEWAIEEAVGWVYRGGGDVDLNTDPEDKRAIEEVVGWAYRGGGDIDLETDDNADLEEDLYSNPGDNADEDDGENFITGLIV